MNESRAAASSSLPQPHCRTTRRFGDPFSVTILVTDACAQGAALSRKIAAYVVEFASWTKGMRRPPPATIRGRRDKSFDQGEAGPSSVAAIWRHGWPCFLVSVRHRRQIISKRGNKYHKLLIYGASGAPFYRPAGHATRPVGQSAAEPRPTQCRRHGVRQQTGEGRVGGVTARGAFCGQGTPLVTWGMVEQTSYPSHPEVCFLYT
jgi:hypothetical protein